MFSLQDLFATSRGRVKLGYLVPLSSSQIGTGWSTVQSPPAIETMPCGSTASTPEVVTAAGLTRVMLPARNRRDYDDIPAGAREKLEFCVARTRRRRNRCRVGGWSNSACAESGCCDADRSVRGGRAARAVTARPARPTPARRDRSVTEPALRSRPRAFC